MFLISSRPIYKSPHLTLLMPYQRYVEYANFSTGVRDSLHKVTEAASNQPGISHVLNIEMFAIISMVPKKVLAIYRK